MQISLGHCHGSRPDRRRLWACEACSGDGDRDRGPVSACPSSSWAPGAGADTDRDRGLRASPVEELRPREETAAPLPPEESGSLPPPAESELVPWVQVAPKEAAGGLLRTILRNGLQVHL